MTRVRKAERDFLIADLASVDRLINQMAGEDPISRASFEDRRTEIEAALRELDAEPEQAAASAALYFGGRPVVGTIGVEADFAGRAVSGFQDLVAKVLAQSEDGALGERGVVANRAAAALHVTNILRGSFGFLLEEVASQGALVDTSLKWAVDEAVNLMDAFVEGNEEVFQEAVAGTDQRVVATARSFFSVMANSGATLKLVVDHNEWLFDADSITRASQRAAATEVTEVVAVQRGALAGVLPQQHLFEFRDNDRGTIHGRVSRILTAGQISDFGRRFIDREAEATMRIKQVLRDGHIAKETFLLVDMREPSSK